MDHARYLPSKERLSVLLSTILLAYVLGQFINTPGRMLPIQLIGVFIPIQINLNTVVSIAVAGMTATGMDWLLRDHPSFEHKTTLPYWILPALTAWIIHVSLTILPVSPIWWLAFFFGGLFLLLVLIAEYIVVDEKDVRHPIATAGLTALAYSLFLILAVSLRSTGMRLLMILPSLSIAGGLVCLRVLQLRLPEKGWSIMHSLVGLILVAQFCAALHYLPFSSISFGLVLLSLLYTLITFIFNLAENKSLRQAMIEPLIVLCIMWIIALIIT